MARIIFIEHSGQRKEVEATPGQSVMQAAQSHAISGIIAECGGCLSCATCHAYIPDEWQKRVPAPSPDELVMVECAINTRPNSRLTCQIVVTEELDGLIVEIPESQV